MPHEWIPLAGRFDIQRDKLVFLGGEAGSEGDLSGQTQSPRGFALVNEQFSGGVVSATIEFSSIEAGSGCDILLYHDPASGFTVTAGLGNGAAMFVVRHWDSQRWVIHRQVGSFANLQAGRKYRVKAGVQGSRVTLNVSGVDVLATDLPYSLPQSQVGIWCSARQQVTISDFRVDGQRPQVFVVMEFSSTYDQLYTSVIQQVCREFNLDVVRADEEYGPGIIVADIARQISESIIVIAEITPANPNVYYEVGYSHALGKDTILLAEKSLKLPFDVSPFRTLFYENTIDGKARIEDGLRKHLRAILADQQIVESGWGSFG